MGGFFNDMYILNSQIGQNGNGKGQGRGGGVMGWCLFGLNKKEKRLYIGFNHSKLSLLAIVLTDMGNMAPRSSYISRPSRRDRLPARVVNWLSCYL